MARILLVEDNAQVLAVTRRALVSMGHHVSTATDATSGYSLGLGPPTVDLLVTDVELPGQDGYSLAQRLQEEQPELAVILTSGHSWRSLQQRGPVTERWTCLSKPYSMTELAGAVSEQLAAKSALQPGAVTSGADSEESTADLLTMEPVKKA